MRQARGAVAGGTGDWPAVRPPLPVRPAAGCPLALLSPAAAGCEVPAAGPAGGTGDWPAVRPPLPVRPAAGCPLALLLPAAAGCNWSAVGCRLLLLLVPTAAATTPGLSCSVRTAMTRAYWTSRASSGSWTSTEMSHSLSSLRPVRAAWPRTMSATPSLTGTPMPALMTTCVGHTCRSG